MANKYLYPQLRDISNDLWEIGLHPNSYEEYSHLTERQKGELETHIVHARNAIIRLEMLCEDKFANKMKDKALQ